MFALKLSTIAVWVVSASVVASQPRWSSDYVDVALCQWREPRGNFSPHDRCFLVAVLTRKTVAAIRDRLFLDGGNRWWRPRLSNGEYAIPGQDGECPHQTLLRAVC